VGGGRGAALAGKKLDAEGCEAAMRAVVDDVRGWQARGRPGLHRPDDAAARPAGMPAPLVGPAGPGTRAVRNVEALLAADRHDDD
jgi:hypothetical protein